jgi:hypothetical protein
MSSADAMVSLRRLDSDLEVVSRALCPTLAPTLSSELLEQLIDKKIALKAQREAAASLVHDCVAREHATRPLRAKKLRAQEDEGEDAISTACVLLESDSLAC